MLTHHLEHILILKVILSLHLVQEKGAVWSDSTKQKVNAQSSIKAELIAIDDKTSKFIWMKCFLAYQGEDAYFIPRK